MQVKMIKIWKALSTQKVIKIVFFRLNLVWNSFLQVLTVSWGSCMNYTLLDEVY